ncbi:hypothetical protein [Undibacterium sp. TJN19]|uniref:hypothetical protein n=1 Tax=Undibacterium sp. TJN19 TaxID=3413055 RepID=UPI003BF1DB8C
MTTLHMPVVGTTTATTPQPQDSGSTGNSAPDQFDASERDIAEGDQSEDLPSRNPQTSGNGTALESDGLNDAGGQSPSTRANDADDADELDDEDRQGNR